jgi:hypothetical protein
VTGVALGIGGMVLNPAAAIARLIAAGVGSRLLGEGTGTLTDRLRATYGQPRPPVPLPPSPADPHDAVFEDLRRQAVHGVAAVQDASSVDLQRRAPRASTAATAADIWRQANRGVEQGIIGTIGFPSDILPVLETGGAAVPLPQVRGLAALAGLASRTRIGQAVAGRLARARAVLQAQWGEPQTPEGRWVAPSAELATYVALPWAAGKAAGTALDVVGPYRTVGGRAAHANMNAFTQGALRAARTGTAIDEAFGALPKGAQAYGRDVFAEWVDVQTRRLRPPSAPVPPVNPEHLTPGQRRFLDDLARTPGEPTPDALIAGYAEEKLKRTIRAGGPADLRTELSKLTGLPRRDITFTSPSQVVRELGPDGRIRRIRRVRPDEPPEPPPPPPPDAPPPRPPDWFEGGGGGGGGLHDDPHGPGGWLPGDIPGISTHGDLNFLGDMWEDKLFGPVRPSRRRMGRRRGRPLGDQALPPSNRIRNMLPPETHGDKAASRDMDIVADFLGDVRSGAIDRAQLPHEPRGADLGQTTRAAPRSPDLPRLDIGGSDVGWQNAYAALPSEERRRLGSWKALKRESVSNAIEDAFGVRTSSPEPYFLGRNR